MTPNIHIQLPRIIVYNINGLSKYATSGKTMERYTKVHQTIQELAAQTDILCLIDTRLHCAGKESPGWSHYYNNATEGHGGTTI